jgi:hypothetical protein
MTEKFSDWLPDDVAEEKTDLDIALEQYARLRAALIAASGLLARQAQSDKDPQAVLAHLLWQAAQDGEQQKAAIRALEEDAGYIAGTQQGECYP